MLNIIMGILVITGAFGTLVLVAVSLLLFARVEQLKQLIRYPFFSGSF